MEICMVPKSSAASQFPGIYLFTSVARLMRPVWNYPCKSTELIGTFEQVYLHVAVSDSEAKQLVSENLAHTSSFLQIITRFPVLLVVSVNLPEKNMYCS